MDGRDHLLLLGSPQSNALSLFHLPFELRADSEIVPAADSPYTLPFQFHFPALEDRDSPRARRYVGGEIVCRPPYHLLVSRPLEELGGLTDLESDVNGEGWLRSDWLGVWRVPNVVRPDRFVTIAAGLHGTGTKAFASIVNEVGAEQLEQVEAQRVGQPYWSALFRVAAIQHWAAERESIPRDVSHVRTISSSWTKAPGIGSRGASQVLYQLLRRRSVNDSRSAWRADH